MAAFTLASLSLIGIPPFSGFVSKWYLALGSLERGNPWILAVLLASSLFTAAYLGPIVYKAYFEEAKDDGHHHEIRRGPVDRRAAGSDRGREPASSESFRVPWSLSPRR